MKSGPQRAQIKTVLRHHLTPVKTAIIKKSADNKCWRGCGEKGALLHCWWECKLVQLLWKTVSKSLKNIKNRATIYSRNSGPGYLFEENKNSNSKIYMYPYVHHTSV